MLRIGYTRGRKMSSIIVQMRGINAVRANPQGCVYGVNSGDIG